MKCGGHGFGDDNDDGIWTGCCQTEGLPYHEWSKNDKENGQGVFEKDPHLCCQSICSNIGVNEMYVRREFWMLYIHCKDRKPW